jgi:hypothetical protein
MGPNDLFAAAIVVLILGPVVVAIGRYVYPGRSTNE